MLQALLCVSRYRNACELQGPPSHEDFVHSEGEGKRESKRSKEKKIISYHDKCLEWGLRNAFGDSDMETEK